LSGEIVLNKKEKARILVSASNELSALINEHNETLRKGINCTDLDEPDYMDMQTCHELMVMASDLIS
jgi:hypothetical protein